MNNKTNISICGCGWLGFPLGIHLKNEGYEVKGSTRSPQKLAALYENGIQPFLLEVTKKIKGNNLPLFFQSEILIINIPPGRKRKDVARSHPLQIAALMEKAISNGVQKIIFISSTSVYGNVNRVVTEADEPRPETASGKALVEAEALLLSQNTFKTTVLRLGGLVGLNRPAGRFLAGKQGVANGKAPVNMLHQEDAIRIIKKIIEANKWGVIYNVCADEHPTKEAFYTHQAQKQNFEPPTFLMEADYSFKEVSNYKLKKELNYRFLHPDPMGF